MSDDDFDDELLNKELEASIESALIKAAEDAAKLFSLEVSEAIRSLSDIRDVTNARILRDTKVASARIASTLKSKRRHFLLQQKASVSIFSDTKLWGMNLKSSSIRSSRNSLKDRKWKSGTRPLSQ